MLTITSIASSSRGNCYRIDDGSTPVLIECGLPWPEIRKRLNFSTSGLKGCVISHSHKDHSRGAQGAAQAGIDVFASLPTLDDAGLHGHRAHPIVAHERFTIGTWTIVPFGTIHDTPGSLGFYFASGNIRLLFATDTAWINPTFKGLTHIMIEANYSEELLNHRIKKGVEDPARAHRLIKTHFSIERVIDFLEVTDISKVQEIRLLHLSAGNSDEELFRRMIREKFGKAVYVEDE